MTWFPTIPGWDGIHPAAVMFPVALLLAAPLLILASFLARGAWRAWAGAALMTMALGTLAAWVAAASGHAAGQLVDKTGAIESAILRHESLGLAVRNVFTVLTLVYAALLLLPLRLRKPLPTPMRITAHAVFLALFVAAAGLVLRAADAGGRLVHERGVRAFVAASAPASPAGAAASPGEAASPAEAAAPQEPKPNPPSGARR